MKPLNLLPALACAVLSSASACTLEIGPVVDLPPPGLKNVSFKVEVTLPAQRLSTTFPFISWFRCNCAWLIPSKNSPPSPDPLELLCRAYRKTKSVELWALEAPEEKFVCNISRYAPKPDYRGRGIFSSTRFQTEADLLRIFQLAADAVVQGADEDYEFITSFETPTLEEAVGSLQFEPDLVFTFAGDEAVRVEFDFSAKRVLVMNKSTFGFYALDQTAVDALALCSDMLEDNPKHLPTLALP